MSKLPYNPKLKDRAKELRKAGNLSEALLWRHLKNKQLGASFDRQRVIGNYIVDFYCAALKLVIEIDGYTHYFKGDSDKKRDEFLQGLGLTVVRIPDVEVKKNLEGAILYVEHYIKTIKHSRH